MKSLLRFAAAICLVTQLTSCQSAAGLFNGALGSFSRLLSAGGRTVGLSDADPVSERLKMDPRDLEKAQQDAQSSSTLGASKAPSTVAQAR